MPPYHINLSAPDRDQTYRCTFVAIHAPSTHSAVMTMTNTNTQILKNTNKRVMHLVWALYYVYLVVEVTMNIAK